MPLFGTLTADVGFAEAPTVANLVPETWALPNAEILQVSYEVAEGPALSVTPAALHPSIPPYATFSVCRFPESPVGPFTLAMVRLIVRAGIRPRALLMRAFVDSEAAADGLRQGWGYRVSVADVGFSRRHNHVTGTVSIDGAVALEATLEDPEPVAGTDLELFDNLHLVNVRVEGTPPEHKPADEGLAQERLIVQVDPGYTYHSADRGVAGLPRYEPGLLGVDGIDPVYGVVAVACRADVELAKPRFVIDPSRPAVQGTRRLDAG